MTCKMLSRSPQWHSETCLIECLQADITLRGYSGYNTRWALQTLDENFPQKSQTRYDLVTLWFGANDAALLERSKFVSVYSNDL